MMNTDRIYIWHGVIADDTDDKDYWAVLDTVEQAHAKKIKNDLQRKYYVVVHGCLRNVLALALNKSPKQISIKKAEHGKPYLVDNPELAFNLSHSAGAWVIVLGWNCRLGVDIEYCKPRASLSALVDKCFAKEENIYWNKLPDLLRAFEFYGFWTRKEAFVKATGRGIALGLSECVINPENQSQFLRVPVDCGIASSWHILDLTLGTGVCAALVADKAIVDVRLMMPD